MVASIGKIALAVTATLGWIEKNAIETRMRDKATGAMVRAGDQKMVAACFRHDTSRNLDPQLHTHAVIANMVQGEDAKWRTMVDDGLSKGKMAIGAVYRAELAQGLTGLGYGIEKTHAGGRFEIEGVPREVIDAFSSRRAEIEAAMAERGMGESKDNPHLAARAALMTRAATRHHLGRNKGRRIIRDRRPEPGILAPLQHKIRVNVVTPKHLPPPSLLGIIAAWDPPFPLLHGVHQPGFQLKKWLSPMPAVSQGQ